ncbi:hypothetical protein Tsubulata_035192 [Turnera subulata]|uniref:B-like cyclin n=1 Tax=Turnera subulata TaxID=218843 RepID=A0A9Q0J8V0_9ROSI|nr:hypothetical protein Tsubulata_035192 [Turnera subulata]
MEIGNQRQDLAFGNVTRLRPVNMKNENVAPVNAGDLNGRITRARAAALRASGLSKASVQQDRKQILPLNSKRSALDENAAGVLGNAGNQRKRRAVLQDVTNVCCENSYRRCFNASKVQVKNRKQAKKELNGSKVASSDAVEAAELPSTSMTTVVEGSTREPKSEVLCSSTLEKDASSWSSNERVFDMNDHQIPSSSRDTFKYNDSTKKEKCNLSENGTISDDPAFIDIDGDDKDPQLCSLYAADIYNNLRVAELVRRPKTTYMEAVQQEITQSMRGILVDWLVEVSEEYKLVPDTLYMTVYLVDCFLSQNRIERQRLQLLGVTCMLIASKYEEICAPRIEEFCFITDNTYSRAEVLEMEARVLKVFGFQLFAPTTKTFLRRFLRAAQASYKIPSYELEYLADYLAELTLIEYSFLTFLPSVIAASAVFLARWTLDQKNHPWNSTLEHYTSYMTSDLKAAVLALQDLQLNANGCPLNAIRMKYRQEKFKSVAALSSPKLPETLFLIK